MVVRFSYDNFQTQMVVKRKFLLISIVEHLFSLTVTHLTVSVIWRRLLFMIFLIHQVLMIIWNIFLWYLSQKLYFPSRFCFTPRTCSLMSAFICLSHLSFHLYYLFLFMYAHYWISWWSGDSNFFNLEFRNCFVILFCNFYDMIPFSYCHQFVIPANISSTCLIIV